MNNILKKIILITSVLAILATAAIFPASAVEMPKTLLALGDSLTTGYALPDYVDENDPYRCKSYPNLIANAMGLEGGSTYINRAVNGDTSAELVSRLPALESDIAKAEMIIISIGGNDMDALIPLIVYKLTGKQITEYSQMAQVLQGVSPDAYASLENDAQVKEAITDAVAQLTANLKTVSDFIKEKAPNARVIFLQQYNPLFVPGFEDFAAFSQKSLDAANGAVAENAQSYGFEVLDVPSIINDRAAELTNIQNYDIHPNEQGHLEIAKLLATHLGISLDPSENTTAETETETDPVGSMQESTEETEADPVGSMQESTEETEADPVGSIQESTEETDPTPEKSGCRSTVLGASLLTALLCAAFVCKKRR